MTKLIKNEVPAGAKCPFFARCGLTKYCKRDESTPYHCAMAVILDMRRDKHDQP